MSARIGTSNDNNAISTEQQIARLWASAHAAIDERCDHLDQHISAGMASDLSKWNDQEIDDRVGALRQRLVDDFGRYIDDVAKSLSKSGSAWSAANG